VVLSRERQELSFHVLRSFGFIAGCCFSFHGDHSTLFPSAFSCLFVGVSLLSMSEGEFPQFFLFFFFKFPMNGCRKARFCCHISWVLCMVVLNITLVNLFVNSHVGKR
jgi:hypothetical protein